MTRWHNTNSRAVPLRLYCMYESLGGPIKMQILFQLIWGDTDDSQIMQSSGGRNGIGYKASDKVSVLSLVRHELYSKSMCIGFPFMENKLTSLFLLRKIINHY